MPSGAGYRLPTLETMTIQRLATPDLIFAHVSALTTQRDSALYLFFGSEDPATGASWCPDCVIADPILRRACTSLRPDLVLYECPVGPRSSWKNQAEHPYRLHPTLRLARIPTLLFLEHGMERGRLIEGDCANPAVVEAFLTR
jgi:thiol-disulfide isomerase/thioredoxin